MRHIWRTKRARRAAAATGDCTATGAGAAAAGLQPCDTLRALSEGGQHRRTPELPTAAELAAAAVAL